MTEQATSAVSERDVLAFVRQRRRENDPRRASDRVLNAYMGLVIAFYVGLTLSGFIDVDLAPRAGTFRDTVVWLPVVLVFVVWGVLRLAAWQGPVLFSGPEMQWVVSSPLSRAELVARRLRRAFVIAAAVGLIGGLVAAAAAVAMIGEWHAGVLVAATVGGAALAVAATAASWHVERSARWSRVLVRMTPVIVAAAAVMAFGAATGRMTALLWSGPWGWVTGPLVVGGGPSVPGWPVQAALLALAASGTVIGANATADRFSEEELWRRAEAHSAAAAALFFGDVRTLRSVARRERTRGRVRGRTTAMLHAPRPWLAIAARDVLALRRSPGRLGTAAALTAGAFTAAVAASDRPLLGLVAFIGLYAAASRLVEPVRLEVDAPDAHRLLPWSWGNILVMHCLVPTVALTVLGWIGLAIVGGGGFVEEPAAIWPLVVAAPFAAAAIVTPAAISAARRPFPVSTLVGGTESNSFMLVLWLVAGPVLAALVIDIAFGVMRDSLDRGINNSTFSAILFLVLATIGFVLWLRSRKPPED